ncbi:hypothetical protein XELAEV_18027077mg, partial [Xenopus laevis]
KPNKEYVKKKKANNKPAELLIPNKLYALEKLEDRVTRFNQFETVLNKENFDEEDDDTIPENLEKYMSQELLLCWDIVTLEKYVTMNRIPRGLRIRKFPTFAKDDEMFVNKWNDTLSRCSFELIALIINHKKQKLIATSENINESQLLLSSFEKLPDLGDLDKEHLSSLEQTVILRKKQKLNRDRMDYENNVVYLWKRPKSILRSKSYQRDRNKPVSFSSDSGEETSFCTGDMTPLRQNRRTPTEADQDDVELMEDTRKPKNYHGKDQYRNWKKQEKGDWGRKNDRPGKRQEEGGETTSVLSKGLSFAPTHHFSLFNTLLVNKFVRKLTLRRHRDTLFRGDYSIQPRAHGTSEQVISFDKFKEHCCLADLCMLENESIRERSLDEPLIGFYPLQSRCSSMDMFQDLVEQDLKKLNTRVSQRNKWNISLDERRALMSLKAATDITIWQADKGG